MIFSWAQDGIYTQGYVGTTFIIESCSDGTHIDAKTLGLTLNTNWGGNRTKKQFLNVLVDTIATYGSVTVPWSTDTIFAKCPDNRVFCKRLDHWDIPSAGSSFSYGIGVYKFTNLKADGSKADDWDGHYASTDFPVFRLADAYLMRAEANLKSSGDVDQAVSDVNIIRARAFGNNNHSVTATQLQATTDNIPFKFILDERGREFYYEAQRRTDLVRFGQFTDGTYTWAWKGGTFNGKSTQKYLNIFPIPGNEVSTNPNIKQNTGY
jgi:hypothetical protein